MSFFQNYICFYTFIMWQKRALFWHFLFQLKFIKMYLLLIHVVCTFMFPFFYYVTKRDLFWLFLVQLKFNKMWLPLIQVDLVFPISNIIQSSLLSITLKGRNVFVNFDCWHYLYSSTLNCFRKPQRSLVLLEFKGLEIHYFVLSFL